MSVLKTVAKGAAGLGAVAVVGAGAFYAWAGSAADARMATTYDVHRIDFPIPFPLTEIELGELRAQKLAELSAVAPSGDPTVPTTATDAAAPPDADPLAGVDLNALAMERAVARGKHLTESLYPCAECHGADLGGGVMIDDPAIGRILGPNLTTGKGSRTLEYTAADWDRMVRHGVTPANVGSPMPSKDFVAMSDRELSDIVAYVRSLPPVDAEVPRFTLGPVGTILLATGKIEISAEVHPDHAAAHASDPPAVAADATYGAHITQACTGCHGRDFAGGPIAGGPPDWPPAANLTPAGHVKGWTYDNFKTAMLEAKRPDGTELRQPMANMPKFAQNMSETELQAMWAFLQTVPPTEKAR